MVKIKNSDLFREVIFTLITIAGRRSTETIACAFMEAIIKTLEEKYIFLKFITIKDITYQEGIRSSAIGIEANVDSMDPKEIGEAIESIIRVLCMDLEEDTGLFFINELKDRLDDKYFDRLKACGVDLNLLKLEQQHLHEQLERKKAFVHHEDENENSEIKIEIPNYSWKDVATFKYRNNICFLFDKHGKLLDRLHANKIIEYYVRTLTNFGKLVLADEKIELTDKQVSLLELIKERDMDEETVKHMLNLTKAELNFNIQQLLRYEFLQYVSYNEIIITDKGVGLLEKRAPPQKTLTVS